MLETRCVKIKLKPGMVGRARIWAAEINRRRPEALCVLQAETVFIECAFLDQTSEGDFLIYFMKVKNVAAAQPGTGPQPGSIGAYHEAFKNAAWESGRRLETLVDLDRTDELGMLMNGRPESEIT